ncbi:MAG: hypothetical protein WCJ74_00935 [bacterium]
MITPLQKTPLKERIHEALLEWAEQEGIDLFKKTSGISISLKIDELPGIKNTSTIEWTEFAVTEDNIKTILEDSRVTPEPRIILEEMLRLDTREITTEMVERLIKICSLRVKRLHDLQSSTHNKAANLNALLIRLKQPYRVDSQGLSGNVYRLRKVKLTQTTIIDWNKKIQVRISCGIQIKGSRHFKD